MVMVGFLCIPGTCLSSIKIKGLNPPNEGHLGSRYMSERIKQITLKHKTQIQVWEFQNIHPPSGEADLVGISSFCG